MFQLSAEQDEKFRAWSIEQEAIALKMQQDKLAKAKEDPNYKAGIADFLLSRGHPYYGAIGGAYTFCFTPTSVGTIVCVEHGYTKNKLDLGIGDD